MSGWLTRHPGVAKALAGERLLLAYIALMVTLSVILLMVRP